MFTPQEVSDKSFPKASFGGYQMESVDEFLDSLTEDYSVLYKENAALKTKLKMLAEKVEEYRATEEAMRSTLLSAQRMAAQMVDDAKKEKDKILAEARQTADEQIGSLERQKEEARRRMEMAQEELADFIRRSHELCREQADFLEKLPEMDLPARPVEEPAPTQDTIRIDKDMLQEITAQSDKARSAETEAPAAEEPAEAEPEAPAAEPEPAEDAAPAAEPAQAEEEDPFPTDFQLNLDELKFGRNYNGEN